MSVSASDKFGNLGAASATLELPVGGYGTIGIQVAGTWVGTITFEGTVDTGTWQTLNVAKTNSSTQVTTTTANGIWTGSVAGLRVVRVRMSAYTSGTAEVQLQAVGTGGGGGGGGGGGVGSDVNLIEVGGSAIALGQAAMAASLPVVLASNQTAIPITGSITASNPSVGPTGSAVPAEATLVGFQDPSGELSAFKAEDFDYDSGAGTQAQTALGLVIPASGGPVPVGSANPLPVTGTVIVDTSLLATAAKQDAQTALLTTIDADTGTIATEVAGLLTDTELRATPVPVSGTVTANAGTNLNTSALALEATLSSLNAKVTAVNTAAVTISAALPAGNNNIGDVDVASLPALVAGSAIIGNVRIDQTTPGTTNGVVVTTALPAGTNNIGDVDVLTLPALPAGNNNIGDVDIASGTLTTVTTVTTVSTVTAVTSITNDVDVVGNVAHDSADSGNPVKIGAKAQEYGATPTAVTAGDRTDLYADRAGTLFTIGGHPNILTLEHADTDGETNAAIITVSAGTRIVVTQIQALLDEAGTAAVGLRVGFATATTPTTTGVVLTHPGLVPGWGISRGDGSAILGIGADNEDLRITSEAPTGGSLRVLVSYFTIAV